MNLLKACLNSNVKKFIYGSSCAVYGEAESPRQSEENQTSIHDDGDQSRDFVNVSDIVEANMLALEGTGVPSDPINIEGGVEPVKDDEKRIDDIFDKLRSDEAWRERFGATPEEVMRGLRGRAA